ncbi:nitroreductase family protein [Methanoplanus limicola]|uniref:Nitroreductase n=1 Tax=Methanoplanus limicola DSM 2279 TaxID=937775 RepID=H1Z2Z7_9EURY|nr:nitroreductase family protein [Methanoplanus limicola]EHQ35537.1 nitroreductase [Methanoplanus limicola DSM 2279]
MSGENEVIKAIMNRRSIRNYQDREVPDEVIETIINAGIHAPSALALQPWSFVVIKDRTLMNKVSDYAKPIVIESLKKAKTGGMTKKYLEMVGEEGFSIFYNAPHLLLILGRNDLLYSDIDCSLCAENIMLAGASLGIGTCWIGSAKTAENSPELMAELKIPDGCHIVAPIIFGYRAEEPETPVKNPPEITWLK